MDLSRNKTLVKMTPQPQTEPPLWARAVFGSNRLARAGTAAAAVGLALQNYWLWTVPEALFNGPVYVTHQREAILIWTVGWLIRTIGDGIHAARHPQRVGERR